MDILPITKWLKSSIEDGIKTCIYQIKGVWTKRIGFLLNVVIIIKTDIETQKSGRVILFSTDLELSATCIIRFYRLRFHPDSYRKNSILEMPSNTLDYLISKILKKKQFTMPLDCPSSWIIYPWF